MRCFSRPCSSYTNLYVLVAIACMWLVNPAKAQTYTEAQELAFEGKFIESIQMLKSLYKKDTSNIETRLLLGRVYSWNQNYDSSARVLKKVVRRQPTNIEALQALSTTLLWDKKYEESIKYTDKALEEQPTNEDLLVLKTKAYMGLGMYTEAEETADQLYAINPDNNDYKLLYKDIKSATLLNRFGGEYTGSLITSGNQRGQVWHMLMLEYLRRLKDGPILGRLTLTGRPGASLGTLAEVDYYPNIRKGTYLYLNAGVGNGIILPSFKLGGEIYQSLPERFEISGGFRYLYFNASERSENNGRNFQSARGFLMLTGTITKYVDDWSIGYRPYILVSPSPADTARPGYIPVTHSFTFRKNLNTPQSHVTLSAAAGDIAQINVFFNQTYATDFWRVQCDWQQEIDPFWMFRIGLSFDRERPAPFLEMRDRWNLSLGLFYNF